MDEAKNAWRYLLAELGRRTIEPLGSVAFVCYAFLAFFVFAALGVWIETWKMASSSTGLADLSGLITALATYYPALIAPAMLQLSFTCVSSGNKNLNGFALFLLCTVPLTAIPLLGLSSKYPHKALFWAIFFSIVSMWAYWIAMGGDPAFRADAPMGGDTSGAPKGSLSGFEV